MPKCYITGVIALRSKCYSLRIEDPHKQGVEVESKAKGVNRINTENMSFQHYQACLQDTVEMKTSMRNIRSSDHVLYTQDQVKVALSAAETKRYVLHCKVHTLPLGTDESHFQCRACDIAGGCSDANASHAAVSQLVNSKYLLDVPITREADKEKCFLYALSQGLMPADQTQDLKQLSELTHQFIVKHINAAKSRFPLEVRKIGHFENKNKALRVRVNVFLHEEGKTLPVYQSKRKRGVSKTVNLLLINVGGGGKESFHYVYIKDLDKFFSRPGKPVYVCPCCLVIV